MADYPVISASIVYVPAVSVTESGESTVNQGKYVLRCNSTKDATVYGYSLILPDGTEKVFYDNTQQTPIKEFNVDLARLFDSHDVIHRFTYKEIRINITLHFEEKVGDEIHTYNIKSNTVSVVFVTSYSEISKVYCSGFTTIIPIFNKGSDSFRPTDIEVATVNVNGTKKRLPLVDLDSPLASDVHIKTSKGVKAWANDSPRFYTDQPEREPVIGYASVNYAYRSGTYNYVSSYYRYVSGYYNCITSTYNYVSGHYRYISGRYSYRSGTYRYISSTYSYVSARYNELTRTDKLSYGIYYTYGYYSYVSGYRNDIVNYTPIMSPVYALDRRAKYGRYSYNTYYTYANRFTPYNYIATYSAIGGYMTYAPGSYTGNVIYNGISYFYYTAYGVGYKPTGYTNYCYYIRSYTNYNVLHSYSRGTGRYAITYYYFTTGTHYTPYGPGTHLETKPFIGEIYYRCYYYTVYHAPVYSTTLCVRDTFSGYYITGYTDRYYISAYRQTGSTPNYRRNPVYRWTSMAATTTVYYYVNTYAQRIDYAYGNNYARGDTYAQGNAYAYGDTYAQGNNYVRKNVYAYGETYAQGDTYAYKNYGYYYAVA